MPREPPIVPPLVWKQYLLSMEGLWTRSKQPKTTGGCNGRAILTQPSTTTLGPPAIEIAWHTTDTEVSPGGALCATSVAVVCHATSVAGQCHVVVLDAMVEACKVPGPFIYAVHETRLQLLDLR